MPERVWMTGPDGEEIMENKPIKVLLIEDNSGDLRLMREMRAEAGYCIDLECAGLLSTGLRRLSEDGVDVALLDLHLPDSQGLETLSRALQVASHVPIVVLTSLADEELALRAMQAGAQDYLIKGKVDSSLLMRSLRYAIERHRMQSALRSLSLVDDLTSLYNRRGFLTLAEQQMRLAERTETPILLIFADLDGMKGINDTFGHQEGDLALITVADILRKTLRQSDIIGRIGGDEFVAVATNGPDGLGSINRRLNERLEEHNAQARYPLSLSLGHAFWRPGSSLGIEALLAEADKLMYENKQKKKRAA